MTTDMANESGDSTALQCQTVRIGFDIGGVLSKYPEALALFRACLASLCFEVHIVTDMPKDKALKMLRLNGIDIDPAYVHACDYAEHGEECKAEKAKELGLSVLIDDFVGYVSIPGAPALRLLAMPDAARDYYHPDWKTDGNEGDFGRRKKKPVVEAKTEPDESNIWQSDGVPYCKVCHKTHGAVRGEKMCGGPGTWIEEPST